MTSPGQRLYRYEVPALIIVNAANPDEALLKALAVGPKLDAGAIGDGPAQGVSVAAVDVPRQSEERDDEDVSEHAESLQAAAGLQ